LAPDVKLGPVVTSSRLPWSIGVAAAGADWWRTTRQHQNLLRELVRRELQARYRGSALGIGWSLLNPLAYMVVYTLVFSTFMRFQIQGLPRNYYPVFLLPGLLAWNFFSQSISGSVNSVVGNASLVKKVAFPWPFLTLSTVIAAFVNYLISLALLIPLVLIFNVSLGLPLIYLPLLILITFALALGLGLLVAAGNVYFRDIEYLVTIALQVAFFLTPIIYQLDDVLARLQHSHNVLATPANWLLAINPMTWIETGFQDVIAFHRWPQHLPGLGYALIASVAILLIGAFAFDRLQGRFAEEL